MRKRKRNITKSKAFLKIPAVREIWSNPETGFFISGEMHRFCREDVGHKREAYIKHFMKFGDPELLNFN